jgi:spore coat polysaccharide biosynthesis protein SpsF
MVNKDDIAIILTVRTGSERLPNKALADVAGKPLTQWIIERLSQVGKVILATTTDRSDMALLDLAHTCNIPAYAGPVDDVVSRMEGARRLFAPKAKYVMRGLGDCPFMATELIEYATNVMEKYSSECFVWMLAPSCWPVYGAREFPYSINAWKRINTYATVREHVDVHFHQHRNQYDIIYHEPPSPAYFRPYRLEVDWQEDLDLVQAVASGPGMLAPLKDIIAFLDANQDVALLNHDRVERTGPSTYTYQEKRKWMNSMAGKPVLDWNGRLWTPPSTSAYPVFCRSEQCHIGFAHNGVLYTNDAEIRGDAYVHCGCGSGLVWKGIIKR